MDKTGEVSGYWHHGGDGKKDRGRGNRHPSPPHLPAHRHSPGFGHAQAPWTPGVYRNIAFVYWDTQVTNLHEREAGYRQALLDHGLAVQEGLLFKGDITHKDGARLTEQVLAKRNVTAIVYGQYMLAEDGINGIRRNRMKIPEDISVALIGCPTWTQMSELKFTCVEQPGTEMGKVAAQLLMERIQEGGRQRVPVEKKIPCTLIYGESVKDLR